MCIYSISILCYCTLLLHYVLDENMIFTFYVITRTAVVIPYFADLEFAHKTYN